MFQLSLLSNWIDARVTEPSDGQLILSYSLVNNPEKQPYMFKKNHIRYGKITIFGPTIRIYEKEFVDGGQHRKVAFWQPINDLPKIKPLPQTSVLRDAVETKWSIAK